MNYLYTFQQIDQLADQAYRSLSKPSDEYIKLTASLPPRMRRTMRLEVQHDLDELGRCVQGSVDGYRLWTAASLMAFRVFEDAARTIVYADLGKDVDDLSLKEVLDELEGIFRRDDVEQLHVYRELRNEGMHAERRFSKKSASKVIRQAIWFAIFTYCIES